MATMTIAQALQSNATGIIIADTPTNIGAALSNTALVARIAQFNMNGNGAAWASLATQLAGLGNRFSTNGNRLTVRDTVAMLLDPANTTGLDIATTIAVFDTAEHLLAIVGTPLAARAGSTLLSTSASLTLAQLITLESETAFSVLPGQSITLADSAQNLMALTAVQNRPSIKAFTVSIDSTTDVGGAATLLAMTHFSIASEATLTIAGTVAVMTDPPVAATLARYAAMPHMVVTVADTLAALQANAGDIATLAQTVTGLTTAMTDFQVLDAAQLTAATALPHFALAPGAGILLTDSVANLIALSPTVAALATVTNISLGGSVDVAQLATLVALPNFDRAGRDLTVADTLVHLAALTQTEQAAVSGIVVRDTVAHLLAASGMPSGTTGAIAVLDGATYTVAQAQALLNVAGSLSLVASGSATALQISDTTAHLTAASAILTALQSDGPVVVTSTDGGILPGSVISAAVAAGLVTSATGILVSDTGAALSALAGLIFGRGFASIDVTSGVFSGTMAQLLDPTLHFGGQSNNAPRGNLILLSQNITASAALTGNTTASVAQLIALSILPNFALASGATLTVADTIGALVDASLPVASFATSVSVTDSETVTAADAAALASIRSAVGAGNFNLGGHIVTVGDDAANIANPDNAAGIALAGAIVLSVPSIATAAQATMLLGLGAHFSVDGMGLTIVDTAAHLATLAGAATVLNGWGAQIQLSADATLSVSGAQALLGFVGFSVGSHHLTLSDTATNLLAGGAASAEAVAGTVLLSQPAIVAVAATNTLLGLHGFSANGQAVTIADTPAHLAAMPAPVASLAASETIVARTDANAADYTLSAAQLAVLQAMPNLSMNGFVNAITLSDTAPVLTGLAAAFAGAPGGSLLTHVVPVLSADATVSASIANTLAHLPNFGLGGHALTVRDTPANLMSGSVASGIAIAASTGIDAPATVSASMAIGLAALHGFTADTAPLTIADTPTALLGLSPNVTALAANERIVPRTDANAADFVLSAAQLQTLTAIPNLSLAGPITVSDTATNLLALQTVLAGASPGSAILAAAGTSNAVLSADATISATSLHALATLPSFGLGGHSLTVSDTPSALLAAPPPDLGLATSVVLTSAGAPWTVSAGAAEALILLPHFAAGPGFAVSDSIGNLLAPSNAAGLAGASSVTIGGDATVSAAQATALHGIAGFTVGTHRLVIDNGAAGLANLDSGTAAMATAIQLAGSSVITVAQFQTIAALPNFSLHGNTLSVVDTAAHLAALTGDLSLIASTSLSAAAIVNADRAQALSTLPRFSASAGLTVSDTAANLLNPADAAGLALAGSVTLTADATVTTAQAGALDRFGTRFSNGGHTLTVADTPAALGAGLSWGSIAGQISGYALSSHDGPWTVSAAAATALEALPNFNAGPGFAVSDSVGNLLTPSNAAGLAGASSVAIGGDATVSAAQATALHGIAGFGLGGHSLTIDNGAAGLAGLDSGTAAMATAIQLGGSSIVTVAQFQTIAALPHFSLNGNTLSVVDSAAHLLTLTGDLSLIASTALTVAATVGADRAQALSTLPRFSAAAGLTVSDTAANLLNPADAAGLALAGSITLTADATIAAAQASALDRFGTRFSNGGHTLTIADTPTALAAGAGWGSIAGQISGYALSSHAGPWTVSAAAATALEALPNFDAGPGFVVSDSVGNLLAPSAAPGLAGASAVSLSADATVAAWQAQALHAIAGFSLGGHQLIVSQGVRGLANLDAGTAAMATAIQLSGNGLASVAQLHALQDLPHFSLNGNTLTVTDSAANLLTLNSDNIGLASAIVLQANATLTAAQAETLAALPGFAVGVAHLSISDSVANLLHTTGAGTLPDDWAGELIASTITLTEDATVTADQAEELSVLGGRLILGGHTLTVSDTAADLLNAADAAGLALAASVTLSGDEHALTAAQATALAGLAHFGKGANSVAILDTAGNLQFSGNAAGIALADRVQLSSPTALSSTAAQALIDLANFQPSNTAPLSIVDTLGHLLRLGSVALSHNNAVLQATSIGLSEDATATVAQMNALAALPEFAHFGLNGYALTVVDSGRHLAAFTPSGGATPTSVSMIGDATLTAAQANALAMLGTDIGDNQLIVSDTPNALLDGANASGIGLAGALTLSANATMSTTQAELLFGNPLFSTGGHRATIEGTAAGLLGLSAAIDADATTLALVADETVSVATLLGLTQLGIEFSLAGHTLTVADTAAHLSTLNSLETNLAIAEVLNADAIVTAARAEILAALPNFSRDIGVTLTIVDTVAHLLDLSAGARAIATTETLAPGAHIALTVAQALGLAGLGGFSIGDATIVVDDTIAHLQLSGWQSVATGYIVTDSISNLVANASSALLADASAVVLLGDAVTDTTAIDTLAGISNFSRGTASLVVADSPDAIAAHAAQILAVASSARIVASTAISAAEAEQLVGLSGAGKLTFAGANHLVVADTYAHLSDADNAGGVALASVIDIADTAANLVAATSHGWGSIVPFYVLTANGTVTGADATALANLGGHYGNGGFVLTMADTAAAVVANGAALTSLAIVAAVSDTIANIDADAAGLVALGARLLTVTPTDIGAVSADAAAGLHTLAAALAGSPIAVTDSAASVVADSTDLLALGSHLGTVTLTDSSPVTVAIAIGLVPLQAHLAGSTALDVSDTQANIVAHIAGLTSLGADLGVLILADGTATSAATAAALMPLQAHLGTQMLTVSDTAAAIDAAGSGLATMQTDGRISSIVAPNETVADVLTHGSALVSLGATATVLDTAAHVNAALDGLEALHTAVTSIVLSDGATPTLTVTIAELSDDSAVLASIVSAHRVAIGDTAAHIQSDLSSGSSVILTALGGLTGIVATDSGTVTLTETSILVAGVDDGVGSAIALFSGGTLVVTDVAAANVGLIANLGVPPTSMTVVDTAAAVQADLQSGSSDLVAHRALISAIAIRDSGTVTLTDAEATAVHVDDGAGSVFAKLTGGSLAVSGVAVARIGTIANLPVAPTSIAVDDTAAHVQADLIAGGSHILGHLDSISAIAVNDAGTVSLTVAQIEAAGVDDGAGSALSKTTGETLVATGVAVADIDTLAALSVAPDSYALVDTAAHLAADLQAGASSAILAHRAQISDIAVTPSGTIVLTAAQALYAGVMEGADPALSLMTGATLVVTEVQLADMARVLGASVVPDHIAVSDTAAHLQADLASGTSALVANNSAISAIVASDAGTIALTVTEIETAGVDDGTGSVLDKMSGATLHVVDAAIADIGTLLGLGVPPSSIAILDSAAALDADLTSGSSAILAHIAHIGAIALTDSGTPALTMTLAQQADVGTALDLISTPYALAISDTAAHLQADLASVSSALLGHLGAISSIDASDAGTITLTQAQVLAAHVDDGAGSVFALLSGGALVVTDVDTAHIGTVLGLDFAPGSIAVSDTAAHIEADLVAGSSAILGHLGSISGIDASDAGTIHLTGAQILAAGVDDGAGSALSKLTGATVVATDVPVADIGTVLALDVVPGSIAVSDTAANIEADLTGGSSALVADRAHIGSIAVNDAGTITLTVAQAEAVHVDDGTGSVLAKMTGETLDITGAVVADINTLAALGVPPTAVAIDDTAAHIQADLESGSSDILAHLSMLSGIVVGDAGIVTLTATKALAAHVDDGAGSVFALLSGGTLAVTDVAVAQVAAILALPFAATGFTMTDTAAHIQADLTGGSSTILTDIASIGHITIGDAGTIHFTEAQIQAPGVDDGGTSVMSLLSGGSVEATDVPIADIATMLALGIPPDRIAVSDTAANIEADLTGGSSELLANRSVLSTILVNDSGTIHLTVAQATTAHVDDGAGSLFSKMTGETLVVTGALVSDVGNLGALIVPPTGLDIGDTAAHIQADLTSGSSHLAANASIIGSITVTDAGTISLTEAQLLTPGVDDGAGSVLAKTSGGSLAVTDVLAADIRTVGALGVVPDSFAISDTAAHIQDDLVSGASAILSYLGAIGSIAVSPAGTITLTATQVLGASIDDGAASAFAKTTGMTLNVTEVAIADIGTILGLGVAPASIEVSDTAANIQADLTGGSSDLIAHRAAIGSIAVSDAGEIDLTVAQIEAVHVDDGAGSVLGKMSGGSLVVTDAAVSDIATLSGLGARPNAVHVSDTAAHIQADLIAGGASHIVAHPGLVTAIAVNDAGTITLTESQIRASGVDDGLFAALPKTTGATIAVTQVLAADVGIVAALRVAPDTIAVRDTAAHIQADLISGTSHILANLGLVTGIAVNPSGTITLTESQVMATHIDDGAGSALSLITGQTLTVTGVPVADIATVLALGVPPDLIALSDTAAHIQADLVSGSSVILGNLASISSIAVQPAGTVTLTEAEVQMAGVDDGVGSALALTTGATLVVTGVPVADIATIVGLGVAPAHMTVVDSEAHLIADLTGGASVVAANGSTISSVTPTDTALDVGDATALYNALLGVATLDQSGLTITGTAADLLTAQSSVPAMLTAAHAVTMDDNPTGLTAAEATTLSGILGGVLGGGQTMQIVDTALHLLDAANAAGIALATDVELSAGLLSSAAFVTALAELHAFNPGSQTIWIQDTVAHLLDPANAAGEAIAGRVLPASDATVTAAQLTYLATIPHLDTSGHAMTVAGTAADIAALSQTALGFSSLAAVADTSAHVSTSLDALQSAVTDQGHTMSIVLSDGVLNTVSIAVTATAYSADRGAIDAITTNGVVRVLGSAAQLAALSSTLAGDAVVGQVAVSDSAANILSNLTALNAIGSKFDSATITDATVSATLVSSLLTIPNLHAGSLTISDTGAQLATAIQASGAPGLAFLNAHTVTLSADSVVTASQALSLQSLTSLSKNAHTLVAWDTASHLIDSIDGYLAAVSAASIDAVYLKTVGGTATVSAATASALFSIPNFSKNNPDSSSNVLTVSDTAAHLESSFAALNAHKTAVSGIVVSATTTVADAVYAHLLTLGATAAFGANLTVRDTAANIVANAPTQLSGSPSITPTAWALSGSATVSIANAAYLGGLSGFSPGAFILTLGADGSASVADANNLGALGSTLHLGGHHVHVAGTVASVSGLTNAAKAIATPDISDTFAHIATLALGGGLLGGTITVTDSASPTVAQAAAFLAILLVGGNGGIPIANVAFGGHVEAITDTLANIQTLTGSAGWTSNASVHADFSLVVADTVAHLIDPSNTAALSAMTGTTLSSNQTATAAAAQSLFALENTINFTLGGHTVTVQDTAANILNPANADGEALAAAWNLSGNDTVSAADAEILLAEAKFGVNGHTLTISDSSDNLLDGLLGGIVSGFSGLAHVHVELSGAETLDAQTAAALVALPGFTNNGDLSIQDSSDYLLNAANHTAEVDASSVTLVGDETVSVSTAVSLAAVPNFTLGSNHLLLASNDYANAAALVAIGNFDTGFDANGHSLTMTQDALNLTPAEYNALQSDNIVLNGHALSALATGIVVTSSGGTVHVAGNGVDGATLNVYAADGTSLSRTAGVTAAFTADASEGSIGNGAVVTETVGASAATSESAPIIALEKTVITDAATAASATFAGSGSVQVGVGEYLNVYTTANAPASPANPYLVYDATAHTLSLDITGHAPLVLVTLGGATHPASLDPAEIVIQHFA